MKIAKVYNNVVSRGMKHFLREYEEEDPAHTPHVAGHAYVRVHHRVPRCHEKSSGCTNATGTSWGYFSNP